MCTNSHSEYVNVTRAGRFPARVCGFGRRGGAPSARRERRQSRAPRVVARRDQGQDAERAADREHGRNGGDQGTPMPQRGQRRGQVEALRYDLQIVDEAFIDGHGTQAGNAQVRLLTRVLCPGMRKALNEDVTFDERKAIFRVVLVDETIAALGLKSPFDVETVIPDLMTAFKERLLETPMFREYDKHAAMFRMGKAGIRGEWDLRRVSKAVNMVLGAAGLSLKGKPVRVREKEPHDDYRVVQSVHRTSGGNDGARDTPSTPRWPQAHQRACK